MGRPKLWENCSEEEHAEVAEIEQRQTALRERLSEGTITPKGFRSEITKLEHKLEEVWKKYE